MAMIDERYASITCQCGQAFQILTTEQQEAGAITDWDEQATAADYHAHLTVCGVMTYE